MLIRDMTSVDSRQERWTRRNYIPANICRGRYRGTDKYLEKTSTTVWRLRRNPTDKWTDIDACNKSCNVLLLRFEKDFLLASVADADFNLEYLNTALSSLLETFMVDKNTFSTEKKRLCCKLFFITIRAYFCCKNRHTFAPISVRYSTGLRLYTWRQ